MDVYSSLQQQRAVHLQGASNFRDIGGYRAHNGQTIRRGLLYRSAELSQLTAHDQHTLQTLKVVNSIDLRSHFECHHAGYDYSFLQVHLCSIEPQVTDSVVIALKQQQEVTADMAKKFMHEMYHGFVYEQQPRFSQFFDLILNLDEAIVFHCTAGKDRTGFACAMLHAALGVHRDDILADYLLTQHYYHIPIAEINTRFKLSEEVIHILWGVEAEYLERALALIDTEFGGMAQYLREQLQLTTDKHQRLMELFLENK